METRRMINPADLLDREGFLRFLGDQARQGWEAETIGATATVFRRTDTPPRGYTMAYDRDRVWPIHSEEGQHIVPCSVEGFGVYPTEEPVLPDLTWPDQVLDGADGIPNVLLSNRIRALPLVLPVVVLLSLFGVDLLSRWGMAGRVPTRIQGPMFWVLLALCLLCLLISCLMGWTNRRHRKGLLAAREKGTAYRPEEALVRAVPVKNRLFRVQTGLAAVTFLLWLIAEAIASGSIRF